MTHVNYLRNRLLRPYVWVILAAIATVLHTGVLYGTGAALVLVVIGQVYLPGWLLARAIGKANIPHPIARWTWILGSGLGLTITLGSVARVLGIPVPTYLFGLHLFMLGLALLPSGKPNPTEHQWMLKPDRSLIIMYLLLGFCIAIVVWVSFQSRYRFWGDVDQGLFIGQAEWMASMPYTQPPGGLPILSRQISVAVNNRGDTRFASDGWTYTHAAWVWTSGVPASQLIWYDLTALFIWTGPLIAFALGYELTGRETTGIWSSVALTLAGLFTVDGMVYTPNLEAFGRLSVFQINTLRFFMLTILLPLAITLALGYLRIPRKRDLIVIALIGAALAFVHPFGITLFAIAIGATTILTAFHTFLLHRANPKHPQQFGYLLGLGLILTFLLIIPFTQRLDRSGLNAADSLIKDAEDVNLSTGLPDGLIAISGLPLLGNTYIRDPRAVFYHPVIALAALLGLLAWRGWHQNLTDRYIAITTSLMLLIAFLPGLTAFVNRFIATVGLYTTPFLLAVALIIGLLLDRIFQILVRWSPRFASPIASILTVLWMLTTLIEPFPIPMSARDELTAFNLIQFPRRVESYQLDLTDRMRELFPPGQLYVVTTPYTVSTIITEELTGVLITGGRGSRNAAYIADSRIYTTSDPIAPWWDSEDVAFAQKYGVTHLILEADDTRLAQAMVDNHRFTLIDTVNGYFIFEVHREIPVSEIEQRFKVMNDLYARLAEPRWSKFGFRPERAGEDAWGEIIADWQAQPDTSENQLGLAFSLLMANRDTAALPVWENLYQTVPNVPLFAQAISHARYVGSPDHSAIEPLLTNLYNNTPILRVMAARSLFDAQFFYLLTSDEYAQITAVITADAAVWHQMAVLSRPEQVRRRAGLLMNAGLWSAASSELELISPAELAPQDVVSLALLRLVQHDRAGALTVLQQASDPDWVASRAVMHVDRWKNNLAAKLASILLSEQSAPPPQSLWALADTNRLYAVFPQVERDQDEQTLDVSAWFSDLKPFANPYPFQNWRFQIINPSTGETYALQDVPVVNNPDALVQGNATLQLPSDLPELTPGHVIIQPRYDDRIFAQPLVIPLILNRPSSAQLPFDAQTVDVQFGDNIALKNVMLHHLNDEITLHLYWQANNSLSEDYQVFVHVFDETGVRITQRDSAPVDGRYPTSQWRSNVLIDDQHILQLPASLSSGTYIVRIGLYRLPNGERLPVTPSDQTVDNSLQVATFTVP